VTDVWERSTLLHSSATLPTIHQTYRHVADVWLPQSGHKWAQSPDFELYDGKFDPEDPQSVLYIYIPIR